MKKFKITEKGVNLLLIFILGFLVGVALKTEAQKRITIGFNDYLVPKYKQDINLMKPVQPENQSQNQNADQNQAQPNQDVQNPDQQNQPTPQDSQTTPGNAN